MAEKKLRTIWEGDLQCAHCEESNHVKVAKEIITPAEPADFEIRIFVEKTGKQATLG